MLKSKKGMEAPTWVLIAALILLIFFIVYSTIGTKLFKKEAGVVDEQITRVSKGDSDGDGIPDIIDKCPSNKENIEGCEKEAGNAIQKI